MYSAGELATSASSGQRLFTEYPARLWRSFGCAQDDNILKYAVLILTNTGNLYFIASFYDAEHGLGICQSWGRTYLWRKKGVVHTRYC